MSVFFYVAAFIMVTRIARTFRFSPLRPKWKPMFATAQIAIALAYPFSEIAHDGFSSLIAGGILIYLVSFGLKEPDFKPFKPYLEAHYPLIAVALVYGLLRLIMPSFIGDNEQYVIIPIVAAFIYVMGRWAASKKQMEQINIFSQRNAELDRLVAERTAELTNQKEELQATLEQLQATQQQLIQSEKLASLGELTAGIAHEIQNPLNFVNNFSEVSMELIDEMQEELEKGDKEEAAAIAADLKENLSKIIHHGKRADGIVKGMLQHSRASSTVKEPTDINKLADEYFRLAYHGLRAKDKSFNAELETRFADNLPMANVVPQDVGRVLLNLFNNAFYAVHKKQIEHSEGYKPTVTVTTATNAGQIIITVRDNGNGIPDDVKDKIMQPFFTTKPTGEGTGLGLSLSYDIIVKGHNGKIDVKSEENTYTEFTISIPV
jgi:two-component system, NtrC family, sensor kinase